MTAVTPLQQLAAGSTPGPWHDGGFFGGGWDIVGPSDETVIAEVISEEADARLITLTPELAAVAIAAERLLPQIRAIDGLPLRDLDDALAALHQRLEP